MKVHYSRDYLVPDLRDKLREWQRADVFHDFRLRIVAAIEGHSERDRVSVRLTSPSAVRRFEEELANITTPTGVGAGSGGEE